MLVYRHRVAAEVLGWIALIAGGAVLVVGWWLGVDIVARVIPGAVTMKANTAVGIGAAGLGIVAHRRGWWPGVVVVTATLVTVIGWVTVVEYLADVRWTGFDQLLAYEGPGAVATSYPGRMGANTAFDYALLGPALLLLTAGRGIRVRQTLATITVVVAALATLGYVLGVAELSGLIGHATRMAVNTSVLHVALGLSLLYCDPDRALMRFVVSTHAGGRIVRIFVPIMLGSGVAIALLARHAVARLWSPTLALQLSIAVLIGMGCLMVIVIGREVDHIDDQRHRLARAEGELRESIRSKDELIDQRDLLQQCVNDIASSPDIDTAFDRMFPRVCGYAGWAAGEAWMPRTDGGRLKAVYAFHTRAADLEGFRETSRSLSFAPGNGMPGRVWNSGQPVVIPDISDDPTWVRPDLATRFGIRAAVAVPALSAQDVVAVLLFHLESPPDDYQDLVATISTVASQLGSTIRHKVAEEALRISEAINRSMLEAIPDLMFRLGPDGTYLDFRVPDTPGYFPPPERFIGRRIEGALPPDLAGELSSACQRAQESGQLQTWEYQYEIDGRLRDREARIVADRGSGETIVIVRDVTDRKEAIRKLETSLRAKDELIASVSHELRTPLAAVIGFAQVLRDQDSGLSPEERKEMIRLIAEEGLDLSNIVDDLLVAAKAQAGGLTVAQVPVDLRAQTAQVLEVWNQQDAGHIELIGSSARAKGDPARVRQILRNLISNALKYGGDKIRIDLSDDGAIALVRVCDNGPGITEHQLQHIFEPYQRANQDPGLTASLGLGLTISRYLARLMDGDLTYRHQAGESIFELTLPTAA
ncbi:MAG: GAF domain-containing protein [Actinobacteria bacterium]|nr:GAF domain-containing protein [Actinomycetota bacterium]